jgi:hypothetical protein
MSDGNNLLSLYFGVWSHNCHNIPFEYFKEWFLDGERNGLDST